MSVRTRILVVEDEPLVQLLAIDILTDAGFEADAVGTGAQALARLADAGEAIDAVVIDIGLPDRRGDEVAVEMRALRPALPILVASGYANPLASGPLAGDQRIACVVKPFTEQDLLQALERLGVRPSGA